MTTFTEMVAADWRRYVKQKNGMDYIPWALLLSLAKREFPALSYGYGPVHAYAGVSGVLVEAWARVDDEHPQESAQLAVTDMRNKTITEPSAADVQNAQQRALAKALSMATGIGLSLWFSDVQLPTAEQEESGRLRDDLRAAMKAAGLDAAWMAKELGRKVSSSAPLTDDEARKLLGVLEAL